MQCVLTKSQIASLILQVTLISTVHSSAFQAYMSTERKNSNINDMKCLLSCVFSLSLSRNFRIKKGEQIWNCVHCQEGFIFSCHCFGYIKQITDIFTLHFYNERNCNCNCTGITLWESFSLMLSSSSRVLVLITIQLSFVHLTANTRLRFILLCVFQLWSMWDTNMLSSSIYVRMKWEKNF